ncbi:MAG: hypothetical protein GF416_02775 [Candidatus Altiarchaeales archaeon]|nr:hypothetical protein [Candidatus Altiarchaeales archaeon]MBD3416043.1 hypothetical protein [Candidatus Altiarchaeales archaeon]
MLKQRTDERDASLTQLINNIETERGLRKNGEGLFPQKSMEGGGGLMAMAGLSMLNPVCFGVGFTLLVMGQAEKEQHRIVEDRRRSARNHYSLAV